MFSGEKLRNERINKGWSQQKLSTESEVSYGYIAELENNKKEPSFKVVEKLSRAMKIEMSKLQE
ncbi:helix-turn-helix domain-containing protein [Ruminiclostridium cellobioparum]|uniref:helix-turn-helix domain-containing protein n=1 Tax=Ruminiclostridium cellobioparum TaxID=29355 RepID=UPI0028B16FE5|nr:helix-turn-helix transcriptional regulator [Ruminiclostridium cellobioparum]